uniref:G_PROTEIN_RECEP_F1_2 domain-containing protein n=1 Tax=Globodera rostochiensis TaxID=31243 RepID=A0A914H7J3_GLORO
MSFRSGCVGEIRWHFAFALTLQLCIGIDRLIGVIFPIWYKAKGKNITFKCAIGICCIRSLLNGFNAYIGTSAHWEKPVMCILGDPNQQPENQYFSNISALALLCNRLHTEAMLRFSTFAVPNIAALFAHNLVINQTKSLR